ncbi:Glycosyl transferase, family 25 [Metarhizium album ARSEF 1941]|uniref:Glycosyl transferase, family 25 n=1 Tax=Metarhizium album (strain ARSEF 1941) TaxID=1081103 RepID=A0A0B2WRT1_METAS|nr:Glycosyl transferase, family 25 [Metarhizium album ARSEF 1941]KHN98741.1 Glycosyl transferase, family 25 [Metarhizium album ARSEF 1941]
MRVSPKNFYRAFAPAGVLLLPCIVLLIFRTPARHFSAVHDRWRSSDRAAGTPGQAAGNSTLGFSGIYFINMKRRYDRLDALSLQCFLSGLEAKEVPAIEPDMINDAGMPPSKSPNLVKIGEKGAWRAHANIWSAMLRNNLPPVIILESDATWDVNIRKIMLNLNKNFRQFLKEINSTRLPNPRWTDDIGGKEALGDLWQSDHWDVLSLGHCHDSGDNRNISIIFHDPAVPPGKDFYGKKLDRQRVIRKAGRIVCTTAYAITQTGAAKLLLKTSRNLDGPLDLIVMDMVMSGELVAYSTMPPIMAQWQYVGGIGMNERGANSDIQGSEEDAEKEEPDENPWEKVDKSGSVWTTKPWHEDVAFEDMALQVAWQRIFGDDFGSDSKGE